MIHSSQNPRIQNVRALLARRKERQQQGLFVLEGVRLVEAALQNGLLPQHLLYSEVNERGRQIVNTVLKAGVDTDQVEPRLLDSLSDTQTSQGILGIFPMKPLPFPDHTSFTLILDNIRDPGNLGAILRTSAGAGVDLVLLSPGCVDAYSPKVLRAGMGAHFLLPVYNMDWEEIEQRRDHGLLGKDFFITDVNEGISCWETDLRHPLTLVIGSEAEGISPQAIHLATGRIHIPMQGKIESLNASIAASILIYEVFRQRNL